MLTDREGRIAYFVKRFVPPLYRNRAAQAARRLRQSAEKHDRSAAETSRECTERPGQRGRSRRDAFDVAAVDTWLRGIAPGLQLGEGLPRVEQFSKGASNLTYLLRYPQRGLILRRPPAGAKIKSAHDMAREYRVQQALAGVVSDRAAHGSGCAPTSR